MMKQSTQQYAGYGLHYHANNQLIPNTADRILFQCLIDLVRKQLAESLDNQTILISQRRLGQLAGLNVCRTIPISLNRLEEMGLIKKFKNGIQIFCDEYVALVQHYESLDRAEKEIFAKEFADTGIAVLQKCNIEIKPMCRTELLGMSGSSIAKCCTSAILSESEVQNVAEVQHCLPDGSVILSAENVALLQHSVDALAEVLQKCNTLDSENPVMTALDVAEVQHCEKEFLKEAILTGKFPESIKNDPQKCCTSAILSIALLQLLPPKSVALLQYSNNIYNNKNNKGDEPLKNETEGNENCQEEQKNIFEGFGVVDVVDFDKLSEKEKEELSKELIVDEHSQQVIKRADRQLRARNSYRNKPFIKIERVKEIVDCLDEVVQSPVDFFLYHFWWGIFDLYCDHYHPSEKINEEGDADDEPQNFDWKEMIGAPLPQDEIYQLAKNVYEDLCGSVEQGEYVYGDHNEWKVTFSFASFEDFVPYEIFQWAPCTMRDKSVPALRISIDKFYDIYAPDVTVPSKGDKKQKNAQNKKFIQELLETSITQLTPAEKAIHDFYATFVIKGEEMVIDEFTDAQGRLLELGGGLPDHILKPWCYGLDSIGYKDFIGFLSTKYKPIDGIHRKAYIFSAEAVVEWNERHGFTNTVAHSAIQS